MGRVPFVSKMLQVDMKTLQCGSKTEDSGKGDLTFHGILKNRREGGR